MILVVDDSYRQCRFYRDFFQSERIPALIVQDGQRALRVFRNAPASRFRCVITDGLPASDNGLFLVSGILETRKVPILLISHFAEFYQGLRASYFTAIIRKPVTPSELKAALRGVGLTPSST